MNTTTQRKDTLGRLRKKLAVFTRKYPSVITGMKDLRVAIEALEILVTADFVKGEKK